MSPDPKKASRAIFWGHVDSGKGSVETLLYTRDASIITYVDYRLNFKPDAMNARENKITCLPFNIL